VLTPVKCVTLFATCVNIYPPLDAVSPCVGRLEVSDVRANTQQAMFDSVSALVAAQGVFYWSSGGEVRGEELHAAQRTFFHHTFPALPTRGARILQLAALLPSAQPVPVPLNPPSALQAVLGHHSAKLAWQPPHLIGGQGTSMRFMPFDIATRCSHLNPEDYWNQTVVPDL